MTERTVRAYVGLGSNLGDPRGQLSLAARALDNLPGTRVARISPLYRSPALIMPGENPKEHPDYLNAVVALDTRLSPLELLQAMQAIEQAQHRTRERRWGPRTLDLDLLWYDNAVIDLPELTVPHPRLRERRFVLLPWHDIADSVQLPDGTPIGALLSQCTSPPLSCEGILELDD